MDFARDHLIIIAIGAFIALTIIQLLFRIFRAVGGNDPAKMQMLAGRQEISDSEFHASYYGDTEQTLVTAARFLFASRAHVPHKLLLPNDRLADFGIQELGEMVMSTVRKSQQQKQLPALPIEKIETLDDMIKLERWMVQNRAAMSAH
ncbi:MAG: hypothetical protein ACJ71N_01620 [Terriglobales bacterium]|jgi:hypothetical protein